MTPWAREVSLGPPPRLSPSSLGAARSCPHGCAAWWTAAGKTAVGTTWGMRPLLVIRGWWPWKLAQRAFFLGGSEFLVLL